MQRFSCLKCSSLSLRCRFLSPCHPSGALHCFLHLTHFACSVYAFQQGTGVGAPRINPQRTANPIPTTSHTQTPPHLKRTWCYSLFSSICLMAWNNTSHYCQRQVFWGHRGVDLSGNATAVKWHTWDLTKSLSSSSFNASLFAPPPPKHPPPPYFFPHLCLHFYHHALSTCHSFDRLTDWGIKDRGWR